MVHRAEQLSTTRLASVGSAVVGACSGLSVANHLLSIWTRTPPQQVLILLCFTVLFSLVAYGFVFRFARRRLASFSPRTRAVWVLLCFLIGAILLVVVPVEPPLPPTRHHLEIVATGDRNPSSQGSEVWILEIQRPDGSILSLGVLRLSEGWEVRDGVLVSYQNQPAAVEWTGVTTDGEMTVVFVSHAWSGVVQVEWDGYQRRLDLYAAKGTQISVALPATYLASRGVGSRLLAVAVYGADLVTLATLELVTSVLLAGGQVCQYVSNVLTSFSASSKELAQHLSESVRKEDKIHLSTLCLMLLLAILLRLSFLSQPMRYDESVTFLNYASRPLVVGLSLYTVPNNHLFHTLLVHMAYVFLGDQPWVIRLPALIAGITLVPASYVAARILFNKHAALLTAGLVAASSPLVEYSTNARGYTLVCLIFVAILALATYLKRSANSAAWALFAVSSALGFYTVPIMLYPFGAVVTWLFLSIILGDANVRRGLLLRNLFLYTGVTAGLTFVLYLPVIVVSGLDSVISNEFLASKSWSVFIGQLPASLQLAWQQWHRDLPISVGLLLLVGFIVSLVFWRRLTTHPVPIVLAAAMWCVPILVVQRVVPFVRIWLFLLPLYMVLASSGVTYLLTGIQRITRHWHGIYAILAVVLSFCLGLNVMRTQSVYFSNDTGTLRDAEAITIFLKDRLGTGDAVLAVCPSDWPLMYYFNKHDVPVKYLSLDTEAIRRVFLVVNDQGQTLEGLLEKAGFPQPYEGLPKLLQRFDSATLYEVNTKDDWR